MPFSTFIADESHKLKNPKAQRTVAALKVAKSTRQQVLLTGTPILNRPVELIPQLKLLGLIHPTAQKDLTYPLGGERDFKNRYCYDASTNSYNGARNLDELHQKLRRYGYIRRNKRDVYTELPEVRRSVVPVEISNRSTYNRAERDFVNWLIENGGVPSAEHLQKITALKKLIAQGKLDSTEAWVRDFLNGPENGSKLIVFAYHREVQQALIERLADLGVVSVTSEDIRKGRHFDSIDRFQSDPSARVIVCSYTAAQTGITLTAASDVAFVEFGWTPGGHDQAEARCYGRVNDMHGANSYYLTGINTYDEDIVALLDRKREVIKAVTEGEATRDSEMLGLLLQRILARQGVTR